MHRWLLGPSLSHYLRVRPEAPAPIAYPDKSLQETKQLLKEHLLDSILERALGEMEGSAPPPPPTKHPAYPVVASSLAVAAPAPRVAQPAAIGYYIYAVTLYTPDLWLAERGVDPTYPIYRYPFGKAQALISKVSLDEFGEKSLQLNLNDQAWFRGTVEKHNRVLAAVQSQGAIVPMRVCTICDSLESLKAFLKEHYEDFMLTLGVIEGRMEWELQVLCNERRLRLLTEKASNRVRALQAEMTGKPPDEARRLRTELERVVAEETRAVCRACIRHSNGALTGYTDGTAILPVVAERSPQGQRLIFNAAYLVNPEHTDSFARQVRQLQKSYASLGFDFVLAGPQPAAHFQDAGNPSRSLARPAPAQAILTT
ncbi:MAG: GvpL/GvpF family gas vesicle protein [Rhodothermales bacterium]|nr:GvpL/GvpF family gas vesicle protein [Rhodothermales bacterium]